MKKTVSVNGKKIGLGYPAFVIAEVSANHARNFDKALKLIAAAKRAGADAVKFQTYTPDSLTIDVDNKYFRIRRGPWRGQTLYRLYQKGCAPAGWFPRLKKAADDLGIIFFSTAFDREGIDMLEAIDVPLHKIASFELTDLELIKYAAGTKKPLILSTGMAGAGEIRDALSAARAAGAGEIILLKCISSYPASSRDMNLLTIPDMTSRFKTVVGLSDHSLGFEAALASVCLGARVIEKHFTLSKKSKTVDSFFSIDAAALKKMVETIRLTESSLGKVSYGDCRAEKLSRRHRRSLFVVEDINKGEVFTQNNIRSIRPAFGLEPKYLNNVLGKRARKKIKRGMPLAKNMVNGFGPIGNKEKSK